MTFSSAERITLHRSCIEAVARLVRMEVAAQRVSQESLAEALALSQAAVSRRLHGHVPFDVAELLAVARLLGTPVGHFLPVEWAVPA